MNNPEDDSNATEEDATEPNNSEQVGSDKGSDSDTGNEVIENSHDNNPPQVQITLLTTIDMYIYKSKDEFSHIYGHACHIIMTQMSASKGLKLYKEQVATTIINEFEQYKFVPTYSI